MESEPDKELKSEVFEHWENESCGTRYLDGDQEREALGAHAAARYRLEPYIFEFARFHEGRDKRVLEIGVGIGADFLQWLQAGAEVTGIDLTPSAIEKARERALYAGFSEPDLQVADAEKLPFADDSFDIVYSWGVLHHSPQTAAAIREVHRVLKPGGVARIMVYHDPSWVGLMLWLRHALLKGRPGRRARDVVFEELESPGTKVYSYTEARELMGPFSEVTRCEARLSPADTLEVIPSAKHQSLLDQAAWKLWPRRIVRAIGDSMGLFLLLEGRK